MGVFVASGMLYIADYGNNRIRMMNLTSGNISTVAGNGAATFAGDEGTATSASLKSPTGVCVDSGKLYIADLANNRIRIVDLSSGNISTLAGNGTATFVGDGGLATSASLYQPYGVCAAPGALYIADKYNHRIRRLY
jgi:internalin A